MAEVIWVKTLESVRLLVQTKPALHCNGENSESSRNVSIKRYIIWPGSLEFWESQPKDTESLRNLGIGDTTDP